MSNTSHGIYITFLVLFIGGKILVLYYNYCFSHLGSCVQYNGTNMAPISWACDLPTLFKLWKPLFFIQTGSEVRVTGSFFSNNYSLFWHYFLIKKWSGLDPGVTRFYRVKVRSVGASLFVRLRHFVNVISDRGQNTWLHLRTGKSDNAESSGQTWQGHCIGMYEASGTGSVAARLHINERFMSHVVWFWFVFLLQW